MDTYSLSIGAVAYALDPDTDIAVFQNRLTEVIQRGGGMIDIPTTGPDRISALASPGLPLVFRTHHVEEEDDSSTHGSAESSSSFSSEYDWDSI